MGEYFNIKSGKSELPGNKGLFNIIFSLRHLQGHTAQGLKALGRRREHSTEACKRRGSHSLSQPAKKPRAKPKIRKLKLNKGIQAEPFPSKAASIWATLSIEDHQTEKCKWFWEIRQISWKRRKVPFESQIGIWFCHRQGHCFPLPSRPMRQGLP